MATYKNWKTEVQKKQLNFIQSYIQYIVITTEYIQTSTVVEMVYTVVYCCCYVLFFFTVSAYFNFGKVSQLCFITNEY